MNWYKHSVFELYKEAGLLSDISKKLMSLQIAVLFGLGVPIADNFVSKVKAEDNPQTITNKAIESVESNKNISPQIVQKVKEKLKQNEAKISVPQIAKTPLSQPQTQPASKIQAKDKLTDNFSLKEFASHDGKPFTEEAKVNLSTLAKNLQVLRNDVKKPVTIMSGYRSPQHNKNVGGASKSQHMMGMAADIKIPGMTPKQIYNKIEELIGKGQMQQGGMGLYPTFVHYDVREGKARWKG